MNLPVDSFKDRYSAIVTVATLYFTACAIAFLTGFWHSFAINILQYLPFGDIVKVSVVQVGVSTAIIAIGVAAGLFFRNEGSIEPFTTRLEIRYTLLGVALFEGVSFWFDSPARGQLLCAILGILFAYLNTKKRIFNLNKSADALWFWIIFVAVTALPSSFGFGVIAARAIKTGEHFRYIVSDVPGFETDGDPMTRPRLLGQVNDVTFIYDPVRQTTTFGKFDATKPITIKQHTEPAFAFLSRWLAALTTLIADI